jgi:hypothetical protein
MRIRELLQSGLAAAIVALFLAGSAAEAAGLHRCPHHDTVAGHSVHSDASHGEEDGGHGCTCFGTCHGSPTLALPVAPDDAHVRSHDDVHGRFRTTSAPAARVASYLLPFANGPPTP